MATEQGTHPMSDYDHDSRWEVEDWRPAIVGCLCGEPEWPGICPGRDKCPRARREVEDDQQAAWRNSKGCV